MIVTVHRILAGAAAQAGAVRINIGDESVILLATDLTIEEESTLLGELLSPDDTMNLSVPAQRASLETFEPLAG